MNDLTLETLTTSNAASTRSRLIRRWREGLLALVVTAFLSATAWAQDSRWDLSADVGFELRQFSHSPAVAAQRDDAPASLALTMEADWYGENSRVRISPFLRLDSVDAERSHFDLREAYWAYEGEGWELLAGVNKVFWGVTESLHLVDVINQTDLVEDLDQEQKLGQPMVKLSLDRDWGLLELFVLPGFRERSFPGIDGRLRTALAVDTDAASYESAAEERHTDVAVRWSHYFGDVDIGVHAFHGTGREPKLLPTGEGTLLPFYHEITQLGVDLQYTSGAWLWKLEALARDGLSDRFAATVAGFEYTLFGINDGSSDLGLLLEYMHDDREASEPVTAFDDDLFLATRWALNDTEDTSLLAGVVLDNNSSEWFFNLEAERRLGDNWFAELRLRLFDGDRKAQLNAFDQEDYFEFSITRYF